MVKIGNVILVGAGPGDPDLITIKGVKALQAADCIVYDYLVSPKLLRYARPDAELIYVGKKAGEHYRPQNEINALIIAKANEGKAVVRLKGGDPYLFGRGGEEGLELHTTEIPFEVIPGIPAAIGMAAYAGIPLTDRRYASQVTFVTGHEDPDKPEYAVKWGALAALPGTLVIYMGCCNIRRSTSALVRLGKSADTPASIIRWATTPQQVSVTATLGTLADAAEAAGMTSPALIVIGDVNLLKNELNWFEKKPLFGKRIIVTRSKRQASSLVNGLEERGAEVIEVPVIGIEPIPDNVPLQAAITTLRDYDWVVFTSVNGVDAFMKCLSELGRDARAFGSIRIAVVGSATADRLNDCGLKQDLQPTRATGRDIFAALNSVCQLRGKRILMPRSAIAHNDLPGLCREAGAIVDDIPAYRTLAVPFEEDAVRETLTTGAIDAITFTSASTVNNFVAGIGPKGVSALQGMTAMFSIGPVTTAAMQTHGLKPASEATESHIPGLLHVISDHFSTKK